MPAKLQKNLKMGKFHLPFITINKEVWLAIKRKLLHNFTLTDYIKYNSHNFALK